MMGLVLSMQRMFSNGSTASKLVMCPRYEHVDLDPIFQLPVQVQVARFSATRSKTDRLSLRPLVVVTNSSLPRM